MVEDKELISNVIRNARREAGLEKLLKLDLDLYDEAKAFKHIGEYGKAISIFLDTLRKESSKETDF